MRQLGWEGRGWWWQGPSPVARALRPHTPPRTACARVVVVLLVCRARTTIMTRHESDLKDNIYWLGLMTHLQNPHVPWKDVTCLRDLKAV